MVPNYRIQIVITYTYCIVQFKIGSPNNIKDISATVPQFHFNMGLQIYFEFSITIRLCALVLVYGTCIYVCMYQYLLTYITIMYLYLVWKWQNFVLVYKYFMLPIVQMYLSCDFLLHTSKIKCNKKILLYYYVCVV